MKKAVIVGSRGQDGRLLAEHLVQKGYACLGIDLGQVSAVRLKWTKKVDILKTAQVKALIAKLKPDEVYYLAAYHHSSQDILGGDDPALLRTSWEVNVTGLANFLEAIRASSPRTRLFYAASSLIFGPAPGRTQNERTPLAPECLYGITKAAGLLLCRYYRQKYGLRASTGILYNHESAYRQPKFLSQKIVRGALAIKRGKAKQLVLGDLKARRDWGYGPDFIKAFQLILAKAKPGEYVISTGRLHSVADFARTAFGLLGLDWRRYVREDKGIIRRAQRPLAGDHRKLTRATGWRPKTGWRSMVRQLLLAAGGEVDA